MRPALKSGLLPVWRDRDTLQIGIDPRRAIALSGMRRAAFVVGLLDGSRERDQVVAAATARGISVQVTERVLTLLAAGGALDDFPAGTLRDIPPALRARLAPELATTSLAHRDGDGGARALARRRAAVVRVEGDQRIGRAVARILSAAGIGRVEFVRPVPEPQSSLLTSGPERIQPDRPDWREQAHGADADTKADEASHAESAGRASRADGAHQADQADGAHQADQADGAHQAGQADGAHQAGQADGAHRAGQADGGDLDDAADLVVLAGRQSLDRHARLARGRVPHLAVAASEAIGVVGPMVVPRRTACLLCMDYVRAGNDSAWPLILAQLGRRRPDPPACDAVLAAAVAAQAAAQALIAIDQNPLRSAAANGTLELVLPDWKWRRRTWGPHPACPCSGTAPDNRQ